MPRWKLRDPGLFPYEWHQAMKKDASEEVIISHYHTRQAAQVAHERWWLFRYCLRMHPGHPTSPLDGIYQRLTHVRYNRSLEAWELWMSVRETASSLLAKATVMKISIDSRKPLM